MEKFTFFWGNNPKFKYAEFSQFFKCKFNINGVEFNCTEQWMHWKKAITFSDFNVAKQILKTDNPVEQKRLGRLVSNFNTDVWSSVAVDVVFRGNIEKFSQNIELLNKLKSTKNTILVEASPYDKIWGIGLKQSDPRSSDISQWQGQNLLGYILTRVRDIL